jgi:hypothetical protein
MKVGAFEMPVPAWCIPVLGLIAVLYVGYSLLSQPIQVVYSRYLLGTSEEQDQLESYKHFAEQPAAEVHNSAAGGTLEAKLFSDGCVSVAWRSALSNFPPQPHFIKKVTAEKGGAAPGSQSRDEHSADLSSALLAAGFFGAIATEARTAPVAASNCGDSHPGTFSTSYGSRNGCWVQVWRRFSDGCEHYQWFNSCANVWDVHPNGTPHVYWTQCRH